SDSSPTTNPGMPSYEVVSFSRNHAASSLLNPGTCARRTIASLCKYPASETTCESSRIILSTLGVTRAAVRARMAFLSKGFLVYSCLFEYRFVINGHNFEKYLSSLFVLT